jgi:hypothetical protein
MTAWWREVTVADNTGHTLLSAGNRKLVPQYNKYLSFVEDCGK